MPKQSDHERITALETQIVEVTGNLSVISQAIEKIKKTLEEIQISVDEGFSPVPNAPDMNAAPAISQTLPYVVNNYYWTSQAITTADIGAVAAVTFTDVALIAQGIKPPFLNDQGHYEDPDLVIAGGRRQGPIPRPLACPGSFVIYSSWTEVVQNCRGFNGPKDGNNVVVQRALQNAQQVANQIDCQQPCQKRVFEIWRGWDCGGNPTPIVATGAVELKILCEIQT